MEGESTADAAHRTSDALWEGVRVYTVGHSTLPLDELVARLRRFGVDVLADIRTVPRSRHNPQFDRDRLRSALPQAGIRYVHLPRLGGLRRLRKDAPASAWRNPSFRAFADYMQTEPFELGLAELRTLAGEGTVALMCAEAVPWRCHRSLVADVLTVRGASVEHLVGPARSSPHRMTPFARVAGDRVTYPAVLPEDAERKLPVRGPFHLEATVRVLQRRPTNRVELWEAHRYLRLLETPEGPAVVQVRDHGTIDAPDLGWSVLGGTASGEAQAHLAQALRVVLGLDQDPLVLPRLAEDVPAIRALASALRGLRPPRFASLFEAFVNVVPFQQLSLDSGVATVGRLAERFGARLEVGGRLFYGSPPAARVAGEPVEALRQCGLSARKAASLHHVARAIASGELDPEALARMPTDEAVRALCALPGIGPWSASLVLLRGLGRLDVFPPGDVGAQRALRSVLGLGKDQPLDAVIEGFGDARGYLYFLGLGSALLAKGLVHAAGRRSGPT